MKKFFWMFVLLATPTFAQQPVSSQAFKYTSEIFDIETPDLDRVTLFFLIEVPETSNNNQPNFRLFGEKGDEAQRLDLSTAYYFRNGKVLFSLGKNFRVVSRPTTNAQLDYLLQSYVPIEQ